MKPLIHVLPGELTIEHPDLLKSKGSQLGYSMARRALAVPGVEALAIDTSKGHARIALSQDQGDQKGLLERVIKAIASEADALRVDQVPNPGTQKTMHWVRTGGHIQTLMISVPKQGHLILDDAALKGPKPDLLGAIEESVKTLSGIQSVLLDPHGLLHIHYNSRRITPEKLIPLIERAYTHQSAIEGLKDPKAVPMRVSGATVGLGTVGELLLPAVTPLAAGVLVATNFGIIKDAANQLTQGKVGVPLFHTALLTCSIVTGQVLAFALTDFSLRYWQRRWRQRLADETQATINQALPLIKESRRIDSEALEHRVESHLLQTGETLRLCAGEIAPVDGLILKGSALVDETLIKGTPDPIFKTIGATLYQGSRVIGGEVDLEIKAVGLNTRAAEIAQRLTQAAIVIPKDKALNAKVASMGDKTALPTLATAGVGWAAGDLITVGAILHQDWVSGPFLAVPLMTLHHMRSALKLGAVVQRPSALMNLSECRFIVIDGDDPKLSEAGLEVHHIESRLTDTDNLLRHVAGAGLYLGDARTRALAKLAKEKDMIVRQPELIRLDDQGILTRQGDHQFLLRNSPEGDKGILEVLIDDQAVATVHFAPSKELAQKETMALLMNEGYEVFLMSSKPEKDTQALAQRLGIKMAGGDLDQEGKRRFFEGLQKRGVKALFVGLVSQNPLLLGAAHATIAVEDLSDATQGADVVLIGGCYETLDELLSVTLSYAPDIKKSAGMARIPNLLCVAGAFGGVLNGITSGIIANMGVLNVDRQIEKKLKESGRGKRRLLPRMTG